MAIVLKIPFDLGILEENKRGAAKAPEIISKNLKGNFVDVPIDKGNFEETQKNIEKHALEQYKKGNIVIGLGGDHSVSYGLIKAFDKSFKNKGLIYFDAHPDCQDYFLPSTYEDILRCVIKDTKICPNILLVGIREVTKAERKYISNKNLKIGGKKDIIDLLNKVEHVYISIDIDVLDPKFAPGTGEPIKNGLLIDELMEMLRMIIESKKVEGLDIVEVCPDLDKNNKTVLVATELLERFLTL
ncbi:MAG: arginase family protein [Candidatus Woesearchaeota archaeon]|nr:MAG: arginase family protein [Candidatus Woesearchaeota archaeon]